MKVVLSGESGEFQKRGSGIEHSGLASEPAAPLADDETAACVIDDIAAVNEDAAAARHILQPEDVAIFTAGGAWQEPGLVCARRDAAFIARVVAPWRFKDVEAFTIQIEGPSNAVETNIISDKNSVRGSRF